VILLVLRWPYSLLELLKEPEQLVLNLLNVGFDCFEWSGRLVGVEVASERNFVADFADLSILMIADRGVNPGIWHVRLHLACEIRSNVFTQRYVFSIAKLWIGQWWAVFLSLDHCGIILLP